MSTTTALLLCLALTAAFALPADESGPISINKRSGDYVPPYHPEEPCSREGGICGLASACPDGFLHQTLGLCPEQQAQGVECCYKVPSNVRDCRGRGGECVPEDQCGKAPREEEGECDAGKVCCIFLF
ncbi:U-scoloptoxin(19)-Tl1a-like [Penaeus indicus]|uniref:U-scoloptoxin(19)-Tl1a-like n=1 Tax=Penaeus indicus TaxID=29960 RepID=UPI00300C5156